MSCLTRIDAVGSLTRLVRFLQGNHDSITANVRRSVVRFGALVLAALTPTAHAALIAYEGFELGAAGQSLIGRGSGFGFGEPAWRAGAFNASLTANYLVGAGSLEFDALPTAGNTVRSASVGSIAGLYRALASPLGTPGTTAYVSLLLRPEGTLGAGAFNGFFGLYLDSPTDPDIYFGKAGGGILNRYVMENRGGSGQFASSVSPVVGEEALLVLKAQFSTSGPDRFTLFVNPIPGAPEPASGTVKADANAGSIQGLVLYSTGAFAVDEIRVGTTFADVAPVPEPAAWHLGLMGGMCWLGWKFRRQRNRPARVGHRST